MIRSPSKPLASIVDWDARLSWDEVELVGTRREHSVITYPRTDLLLPVRPDLNIPSPALLVTGLRCRNVLAIAPRTPTRPRRDRSCPSPFPPRPVPSDAMGSVCGKEKGDNFSSPGRPVGTAPPPQGKPMTAPIPATARVGGPPRTLGGGNPSGEQSSADADDARRRAAEAAEVSPRLPTPPLSQAPWGSSRLLGTTGADWDGYR